MVFIAEILSFFGYYTPVVSFIGGLLGGNETLLFLSILASGGFLNIYYLFIFFYIGSLISDSLWFLLGRSKLFEVVWRIRWVSKFYPNLGKFLRHITKNKFWLLFITKFLYGSKILTLLYLSRQKIKYGYFIKCISIINLIWVSFIIFFGWSAGMGVHLTADISQDVRLYFILVGIVMAIFLLFIKIISSLLEMWLRSRQNR